MHAGNPGPAASARIDLLAHPRTDALSASRVYGTTARIAHVIGNWLAERGRQGVLHLSSPDEAVRAIRLPPYLGGALRGARPVQALPALLSGLPRGRQTRPCLGVVNGFGSGIGETLVGLTAARSARDHVVAQGGPAFVVDLIVDPDTAMRITPLAKLDPLVNRVVSVPQLVSRIQKYDGLWDFDSFLLDPGLNDMPLVDYFLDRLGVAAELVDAGAKENRLRLPRAPEKLEAALAGLPGRMLLFHPTASARVRSVPDTHARRIVADILRLTDYTVATAVPFEFDHPRFVRLAPLCADVLDLCHIVSRAHRIVTVDTSVCHLAAAFGVATVALFTTIAPELRVKYYPSVMGILLDGARNTAYFGAHTDKDDVPPENVFALWERFDVVPVLHELESHANAARA